MEQDKIEKKLKEKLQVGLSEKFDNNFWQAFEEEFPEASIESAKAKDTKKKWNWQDLFNIKSLTMAVPAMCVLVVTLWILADKKVAFDAKSSLNDGGVVSVQEAQDEELEEVAELLVEESASEDEIDAKMAEVVVEFENLGFDESELDTVVEASFSF